MCSCCSIKSIFIFFKLTQTSNFIARCKNGTVPSGVTAGQRNQYHSEYFRNNGIIFVICVNRCMFDLSVNAVKGFKKFHGNERE